MTDDIHLHVNDWPAFGRSTELSIDPAVAPADLGVWCRDRYGKGALRENEDGSYVYDRGLPGPAFLWKALSFVLGRSYQ